MKSADAARILIVVILTWTTVPTLVGCYSSKGASGTEYAVGDVQSIDELIEYLEDIGMNLPEMRTLLDYRSIHTSAQEVFLIDPHEVDGYLVAYEYTDPDVAAEEARHINFGVLRRIRETVVTTSYVEWYAPVYQNGHMVVVYMGQNQGMNNAMSRVLGQRVLR